MDEYKWARHLLEMMYTLWFMIFNIKLKTDFKDYYCKITEFALILFDKLSEKGIKPNESIFQNLIEACSFCGMNDRALEIVTSIDYFLLKLLKQYIELNYSKTEISPIAHGVYLEAISKAREFKAKQEKTILKSEETKDSENNTNESHIEKCVIFMLSCHCKNCSEIIHAEEIINGWKKSYNDYITTCHVCSQTFLPEYLYLFLCFIFH